MRAIHILCNKIEANHIPITMYEVSNAIEKLKRGKAKDEDGLVAEHLKEGGPSLIKFITCLINRIIQTKEIPDRIKGGIIHPLHKKGKPINKSGNHRGITIISVICKVLAHYSPTKTLPYHQTSATSNLVLLMAGRHHKQQSSCQNY